MVSVFIGLDTRLEYCLGPLPGNVLSLLDFKLARVPAARRRAELFFVHFSAGCRKVTGFLLNKRTVSLELCAERRQLVGVNFIQYIYLSVLSLQTYVFWGVYNKK